MMHEPTTTGWYLDRDDNLWNLSNSGGPIWTRFSFADRPTTLYPALEAAHAVIVHDAGPFRRLRPRESSRNVIITLKNPKPFPLSKGKILTLQLAG